MKAYVMQPPYSRDPEQADALFQWKLDALHQCGSDADLIVLPEYSDVPCVTGTLKETLAYHEKYSPRLLEAAAETARRCQAVVCVNGLSHLDTGYRNTTFVFDKSGTLAGRYYKRHLPPLEYETLQLDSDYTMEPSQPDVLELDGVRYAFLTCYDFYFYEAFSNIARQNVDIIVGCSLQRSDTHDALEIIGRFLSYNTNAYLVRSSVTFGADSPVCGSSMIVAPDGQVLANLKAEPGMACATFDPHAKYRKPAGFGREPAAHYEYIEWGRRPWQYRPAGPAMVRPDALMPFPRVCAHRGFNTVAPENSMPAYGAAIAMGADEIEMDLWETRDGVIVSCHDPNLDRVSTGTGFIWEYTYRELLQFDFGIKVNPAFAGMKIPTFEDILKKFTGQTILNIHIKDRGYDHLLTDETLQKIINLIYRYDCQRHCYFMSGFPPILAQLQRLAPEIPRCAGAGDRVEDRTADMVEKALNYGCTRIQLFEPYFQYNPEDYVQKTIEKAHANGIRCNLFYSDDPAETKRYLEMGIDTILTNDYQRNAQAVQEFQEATKNDSSNWTVHHLWK